MKELSRAYDPKDIESRLYEWWLEREDFRADPSDPREPYCIVIPPPNVTGYLHVGHALVNTLQDVLVRRQRMLGRAVLWLPGTDHAGIATQVVVERKLAEEGRSREELGRQEFEEEVWRWKEQHGEGILAQLKKLGCSCDWSRTRFTMDPGLSRAVREVFVDLHARGLIYRGPYMVSWCPRCHTALSDLEVEHEEQEGRLWHLAYPLADGDGEVVVATTRPETMLGDTAVAVHPDDERYRELVGREVILPLMDRRIRIVADEVVEREFGTGAVKVTPAHDPNDLEIGRRHELPSVVVIAQDGVMTDDAGDYAGMDRFAARQRVVEDLRGRGLLRGEEEHRHAVGHCQRCHSVVEPLVSHQWFLDTKDMAARALAAVESGRTKIVPDQYRKVYEHWMRNIRDWCISRQLWWGHRIPAWYCGACSEMTVALEDPTQCASCGSTDLEQDEDVLDTWFSSALWPFSTMGWPDREAPDLKKWYPTSVLVTGFDILFFWVARMMMMGLEFMKDVPFDEVFLHGLVRDAQGDKMSKVKGNVIDPLDVIDSHGADALRFTLAIMLVPARDLPWNPQRMEGYRTFANKLWQASRFVQMNLTGDEDRDFDQDALELPDRWILSRLSETASQVNEALDAYRFDEAGNALYHFIWNEFCAWYIEMAKPSLQAEDGPLAERAANRRRVLLAVLDDSLRLLHPLMPFLTEELWQHFPHEGETIQKAAYPRGDSARVDARALEEVGRLQEIVTAIRNVRAETGISPRTRVPVRLVVADGRTRELLSAQSALVQALARTEEPELLDEADAEARAGCVAAEAAGVTVLIPLAGVLDLDAERRRLGQQLAKANGEIDGLERRLGNAGFVEKAPAEVVAESRARRDELVAKRERLERTLAALSG